MSAVTSTRLFDRHTHVSLYAALADCANLSGLDRHGALQRLMALPQGRLSTVLGWRRAEHAFTDGEQERLPPALLVEFSLHGFSLTPAAEELLRPRFPEMVERQKDPEFAERNLPRLLSFYATSAGLSTDKLERFMTHLAAGGIDRAEDMLLVSHEAWQVMETSSCAPRLRAWAVPELFATLPAEVQGSLAGLKLFLDGALGARTAALSESYRGGGQGLLMYSDAGLRDTLQRVLPTRKPLALHAIGDLAIAQALDALSELKASAEPVRLEHVQFITEAQARRARDLGLTLSMQPNFNAESQAYADRLVPHALERNNPFRMLIDRAGFRPGKDLLFGSDGMPHGIEYAAQWGIFPLWPGQRLSAEELFAGYGAACGGEIELEVQWDARRVRLVRR